MIRASNSFLRMLCLESETKLPREVRWLVSIKISGEYLLWEFVGVVMQ